MDKVGNFVRKIGITAGSIAGQEGDIIWRVVGFVGVLVPELGSIIGDIGGIIGEIVGITFNVARRILSSI